MRFQIFRDGDGDWRWEAVSGSGLALTRSAAFATEAECRSRLDALEGRLALQLNARRPGGAQARLAELQAAVARHIALVSDLMRSGCDTSEGARQLAVLTERLNAAQPSFARAA